MHVLAINSPEKPRKRAFKIHAINGIKESAKTGYENGKDFQGYFGGTVTVYGNDSI